MSVARLSHTINLQEVVVKYLNEVFELDAAFFLNLISQPQQSGRLFIDLKINSMEVKHQLAFHNSLINNELIISLQNFVAQAVRGLKLAYDVDVIQDVQLIAHGCFVHIKRYKPMDPDAISWDKLWIKITAGMTEEQKRMLERRLAGAFTFKIAAARLNPMLLDPELKAKVKFFTQIISSKLGPQAFLEELTPSIATPTVAVAPSSTAPLVPPLNRSAFPNRLKLFLSKRETEPASPKEKPAPKQ